MELQKYLQEQGLEKLCNEYKINVNRHQKYPNLVCLKYSQIESPMSEKVVQQSRGIILDESNNWEIVSYSYDKFFNYGEPLAVEIDWHTATVYDKLDGCFLGDQFIDCWDGSLVKIKDIVNKGLRPVLVGLDKEGNIVPSFITNVKNNGTKDNWIDIYLEDKIQPQSTSKRSNRLRVTTNHHIYLNGEYVKAESLSIGDTLTTYENRCNSFLLDYIQGSLLGDGHISSQGTFSESHSSAKIEFINWQISCLGKLFTSSDNLLSGYGSETTRIKCVVCPDTKEMRNKWYRDGKKIVPRNLKLTNLLVAKWYLDDGSRQTSKYQRDRAVFATNSFTKEDCEFLAEQLRIKYNVSVTVFNHKGWNIRINSGRNNEITFFWKSIAPYIPLDMEYKIPSEYRNFPKTVPNPIIEKRLKQVFIIDIKPVEINKVNFPSGRQGYDIETTTNNYFSGGLLVHNSLMVLYYYDNQWQVQSSGTADGSGEVYGFNFSFAQLFWRVWHQLNYNLPKETDYCFSFELLSPYNRIVVKQNENNLVLHGVRNIRTLQEEKPEKWAEKYGFNLAQTFPLTNWQDIIKAAEKLEPLEAEGYVICDAKFNRIKVKSPQYVAWAHFRSSFSTRKMLQIILNNEGDEFLNYYPEWTKLYNNIYEKYLQLIEEIEITYNEHKSIPVQKDFALAVKHLPYSGILFALRGGKYHSIKAALAKTSIPKIEQLLGVKYIDLGI